MIYKNRTTNKYVLSLDQTIWACRATDNHYQKTPIKGKIMSSRNEHNHNQLMKIDMAIPKYFVPFDKNGRLAWSKAVRIESLYYADTKSECIWLFNHMIQKQIENHKHKIEMLQNTMIKPEDDAND